MRSASSIWETLKLFWPPLGSDKRYKEAIYVTLRKLYPLNFQILAMLGLSSYLIDMLPMESIKHLSKLLFLPYK